MFLTHVKEDSPLDSHTYWFEDGIACVAQREKMISQFSRYDVIQIPVIQTHINNTLTVRMLSLWVLIRD